MAIQSGEMGVAERDDRVLAVELECLFGLEGEEREIERAEVIAIALGSLTRRFVAPPELQVQERRTEEPPGAEDVRANVVAEGPPRPHGAGRFRGASERNHPRQRGRGASRACTRAAAGPRRGTVPPPHTRFPDPGRQ